MRGDGIELLWPGKYDAAGERSPIPSPGLRMVPTARYGVGPPQGTLVRGDNLAVMDALLRSGDPGLDLVIIDPPFATGEDFSVLTQIGEGREVLRAPAYSDRWRGGLGGFMAMLDPRLRLLHRLLADHGSLYVHLDANVVHPVKVLLDEIFGPGCFQREIIWRIGWVSGFKSRARNWIRNHDTILFYVKDPGRFTFNKRYIPYPPGYRRRDGKAPKGVGIPIDDVWNAGAGDLGLRGADSLDSIQIKSFSREKTGWATQKNESLLRRIIEASSRPGDRVADFFCGSGSTLAAAAALGRRWIGCDQSLMAIHLARKRLREVDAAFTLSGLGPGEAKSAEKRSSEEFGGESALAKGVPPAVQSDDSRAESGPLRAVNGGELRADSGAPSELAGGEARVESGPSPELAGGESRAERGPSSELASGDSRAESGSSRAVNGGELRAGLGAPSELASGDSRAESGSSRAVNGGELRAGSGVPSELASGELRAGSGAPSELVSGKIPADSGAPSELAGGQQEPVGDAIEHRDGSRYQLGDKLDEDLLAGLEIGGQEAWLRVCPRRTLSLEELRRVQDLAAERGCQRLRVVARRWGFALAELQALPDIAAAAQMTSKAGTRIETACLHWRGDEPALPRTEVNVRWSTPAPWQLAVELVSYRIGDPSLLPDAAVVEQVGEWSEWVDAWALALDSAHAEAEELSNEGLGTIHGLFEPIVEHFRTRRRRSLSCLSQPVDIARSRRAPRIPVRVQIVDILGLETIWPWELVFDGQGQLSAALPGYERASAACLLDGRVLSRDLL